MKVIIVMSAILALTAALSPLRSHFTSRSGFDSGRYKPSNDGRYTADKSGAYNANDGKYHPDNTGAYIHQDNKYIHQDNKYKHQADKFGNNGGNYKDGEYNSANGGNGQYVSNSAGSSVNAGNKGGNKLHLSQPSKQLQQLFENGNNNKGNGNVNNGFNGVAFGFASNKYDNRNYRILKKIENVEQDGYHYLYETENGIEAKEQGKLTNVGTDAEGMRAHGFYTYTGPDNVVYTVRYTADENGFVPEGAHIPTPPPIPAAILRALKYHKSIGTL